MIRKDKNYDIYCQIQLEANKDNSLKKNQIYRAMPYAEILFDTFDMQGYTKDPDGWIQFGSVDADNKAVITAIANSPYCDDAINWVKGFVAYASKNVAEKPVVGDWTNISIYKNTLNNIIKETAKLRNENETSL